MWIRYRIAIRRIPEVDIQGSILKILYLIGSRESLMTGATSLMSERKRPLRKRILFRLIESRDKLKKSLSRERENWWSSISILHRRCFFKRRCGIYKKRAAQQVLLFKALLLRLLNQVVAPPDLVIRFSLQGCRPVRCALWELFFPLDLYSKDLYSTKEERERKLFLPSSGAVHRAVL